MVRFAVICASNQNRSMEAHHVLSKKGLTVDSYGTNSQIKIPGPTPNTPNSYPFGTTYDAIYADLKAKDATLYTQNGLLLILERNRRIKKSPQRWQECEQIYNVVVTCEERCFDIVCEDFGERGGRIGRPVHIVNFDIRDTPEDATVGARAILQLAQMLQERDDIDRDMEEILAQFMPKTSHPMLYSVQYY